MREKLLVFEMYVELTCVSSPNCEFVQNHLAEGYEIPPHASQRLYPAVFQQIAIKTVRAFYGFGIENHIERQNDVHDRVEATAFVFGQNAEQKLLPEVPPFCFSAPFGFHSCNFGCVDTKKVYIFGM